MSDARTETTNIVKKLTDAGYTAYFAGGWVRDLVMGHPSNDIDVYQKVGVYIVREFIASWHPVLHYRMQLEMKERWSLRIEH